MIQAYINKKLYFINTIICITQHSGQLAPSGCNSILFLQNEVTKSATTPLPRMGYQSIARLPPSISSGFPNTSPVLSTQYSWVERCTVKIQYLAQEQNTMIQPRNKIKPLDPQSRALCIRILHPPQCNIYTQSRLYHL